MTDVPAFPHGTGGEMAGRLAAHGWSATPLGPAEAWPQSLRTAVGLMLEAKQPAYIAWGPELTSLYNDGYARFCGTKHPLGFGTPFAELWAEVWDEFRPIVEATLAGEAQWFEDRPVALLGRGSRELSYFSFSYTPLRDDRGGVAGFFCVATETTDKMLAQQRQLFRLAVEERLRALADPREIMAAAAELLGRHLDADRAGYGEVEAGGEFVTIERDWTAPGVPSAAGRHRLDDFGTALADALRAGRTVRFDDALAAYSDVATAFTAIGIRAAITVPLVKGGRFAASLYVHRATPRRWTGEDEALVRDVAERTWAAVEQTHAEARLRESERFARRLIASSSDTIEVLELNGSVASLTGGGRHGTAEALIGAPWETLFEPADRDAALAALAAARTGAAGRFEAVQLGADGEPRWQEVAVTAIPGDDGRAEKLLATSRDVTERRRAAERQTALVELSDRLRDGDDPATMAGAAAALLGRTLGAARAGFGTVDAREQRIDIRRDWTGGAVPSAAGSHRLAVFWPGPVAELRDGGAVAVDDAECDPRIATPEFAHHLRAFVGVALVESGRIAALLFVQDTRPRRWTAGEIAFVHDVAERSWAAAERARAEAELRRHRAHLDAIIGQAAAGIAEVGLDGRFLDANDRFCAIVGRSRADLADLTPWHFTHPDDLAVGVALLRRAQRTGEAYEIEKRYLRPDGGVVWVQNSITAIRGTDGRMGSSLAVTVDITARKAAEAGLLELNSMLERRGEEFMRDRDRIWALTEDLFVLADYAGALLRVSPSWHRLLGHAEAVLLGRRCWHLFHPRELRGVVARLDEMRRAGRPVRHESRLRAADGSWRWVAWTLTPDPGGQHLHGVGRDITAEREAAEALGQAEEQLRQAHKMEAVGQLTGGIAHDFNNMLQGIGGALDLAQRRVEQGRADEVVRLLNAARHGVVRAASLTHRLLAFARRQALDARPMLLDDLVRNVAELVGRTVGPEVELRVRLFDGSWPVLCDANQLENALLNLAINARDAMPGGGVLTLTTTDRRLGAADVAGADEVKPGEFVEVAVADTGEGMTPDVLARAFEPFFTTKPIGQGTGLGLSQLYGFVRQSGGLVRLESAPGQGTTVRLLLPRHTGADVASGPAPEQEASNAGAASGTVLVVEDDNSIRGVVAAALRDAGCRVLEAADGPSGLRLLRSARVDLLVTDVGLPGGMNGRQVAEAARERQAALPVLFITGYAGRALPDQLAPGMELIGKPFTLDALVLRVRTMLAPAPAPRAQG